MGDWRMIRLIATRELRERARTRGFVAATAVLLVAAVAAGVVPRFLDDDKSSLRVGLVGGPRSAALTAALNLAASEDLVRLVPVGSVGEADEALREREVDVVVEGTTSVRIRGERTGERAEELAGRLAGAIPVVAGLETAGLPPERIGPLLSPAPLPVRPLVPPREDTARDAVFIGALALYVALLTYGGWVGTGVLEEKSSRVVEVVLAAVRPAELLAGKVIGIGVLGLGQLALVGGVGLLSAVLAGSDAPSSAPGAVGLVLLWFVLGFAFYSCAFAVAGASASRQEDAQSAMGPLYVLLVVAYLATGAAQASPDGALARISSFVPPLAPLTGPSRVLLGHAPFWEVAASVALTLVATVGLIRLAGRMYGGAVLRFGPRLGLRELVSPPT
jgi:ABC-2 type transport system permease protein